MKGKSPDTRYLTGYLATLLLLLLSYTIRYSIFSAAGLVTGQVANLIVFGVVCLVQFAYHYGGCLHKKESRLALYLFLIAAAAAWSSNFFRPGLPAVYDFQAQYFTYEFGPRISVVTLAENANDAILILSKEGRVVYTNTRAAGISGYSPVELRKKHFRDVIHPDELAVVEERFTARIDGRTAPRCYESVILNRKGEVVPVEITGARTIWHDEPADVVIIRDISERKRAEELLQAQQQQLLRADKLASLGALVAEVPLP